MQALTATPVQQRRLVLQAVFSLLPTEELQTASEENFAICLRYFYPSIKAARQRISMISAGGDRGTLCPRRD